MDLNYAPITESPVYAKSKKLLDTTGKRKLTYIVLFFLSIFAIFGVLFLVPILMPVVVIAVFAGLIFILIKSTKKGSLDWKNAQLALVDFAKHNSFEYKNVPFAQITGENLPEVTLVLPFKAKLETNSGAMSGMIHGMHFDYISGTIELIDYKGMSAQRGAYETRSLSAMFITLPVSMPRLFIDNKRNNISGFEAGASNIEEVQDYNLEGNFPAFYRIYAQKDDQINALSILTPEVMLKLLEHTYYDIWIDGNTLVIYALASPFEYLAGIPVLFPMADMLLREIDVIARATR